MDTIKCPFEPMYDKEMPLATVFDTFSVGKDVAERVAAIIRWIVFNKNKNAAKAVYDILKANLGKENLDIFTNMYLKTYDRENKKVLRYHPVDSEETIKNLFYIFNTINKLIPTFKEIALYYKNQQV